MLRDFRLTPFVSQPARRRLLIALMVMIEFSPLIAVAALVALHGAHPPWP